MIKDKNLKLLVILLPFLIFNCSNINVQDKATADYISMIDQLDFSNKVEENFNSVVKVNSYNMYTQYKFTLSDEVDRSNIEEKLASADTNNIQRNSAGTALVLKSDRNEILVLTALHIVDYPEERFVYYNDDGMNEFINVYMRKESYKYNIIFDDKIIHVEPIIKNQNKDLVLLKGKPEKEVPNINYLDVQIRPSHNVEYGDLIYILGYPKGKKMVTHGMISSNQNNRFIVDAAFNKGMSGGVVFAINKGTSTMEMIGMATSAAASYDYLLTPPENIGGNGDFNEFTTYEGDIFIDRKATINYGITFVNNVYNIMNFLENNRENLKYHGFDINQIFRNYYRDSR